MTGPSRLAARVDGLVVSLADEANAERRDLLAKVQRIPAWHDGPAGKPGHVGELVPARSDGHGPALVTAVMGYVRAEARLAMAVRMQYAKDRIK